MPTSPNREAWAALPRYLPKAQTGLNHSPHFLATWEGILITGYLIRGRWTRLSILYVCLIFSNMHTNWMRVRLRYCNEFQLGEPRMYKSYFLRIYNVHESPVQLAVWFTLETVHYDEVDDYDETVDNDHNHLWRRYKLNSSLLFFRFVTVFCLDDNTGMHAHGISGASWTRIIANVHNEPRS